jgi:hypothetical protein
MLLDPELRTRTGMLDGTPVAEAIDETTPFESGVPVVEVISSSTGVNPEEIGTLPDLRLPIGDLEADPTTPPSHTRVGPYTVKLLVEVRKSTSNPHGIKDGKAAADGLFAGDYNNLEAQVAAGYSDGKHPNQIYRELAGDPPVYDDDVMRFPKGTPVLDAALQLRTHQERKVSDGINEFTIRNTSDGRFRREHEYPHDAWGIGKGYNATGDISKIVDLVDIMVFDTLRKGKPANGIIVSGEEQPLNYYDGRASRLSLFYLIRVMGEHYGEDVYAHKPYIKAMELLWKHFNPPFPEAPVPNKFNAYRRGIVTPEGWRVSRWGDDTNNGKKLEEYLPRLEMAKEDLEFANEAASRAAPADRARVRANAIVGQLSVPESGRDFDLDRYAGGKDQSYINTSCIIPNDLQCEMADAAEVLIFSWDTIRRHAAARGDSNAERMAEAKVSYYLSERDMRIAYVNTYGYNQLTGGFEDVELLNPTELYDTQGTFSGWRRTGVISSSNNMAAIYSGAVSLERGLSAKRIAERELLDRGGLASTNSRHRDHGQWAGDEAWMIDQRLGACASAHFAARYGREAPEAAAEVLDFGKRIQKRALSAVQTRLIIDGTFPEHWNARDPEGPPADSEYDPQDNLAMTAEGAVELELTDLDVKTAKLAAAAGRFVVSYSPRRRRQIFA